MKDNPRQNQFTTGVIVDVGYENTLINCIYEGFYVSHARKDVNLGIRDIVLKLHDLLIDNNKEVDFEQDHDYLHYLTEEYCGFNTMEIKKEEKITLEEENIAAVEVLVKGNNGIPVYLHSTILSTEINMRKRLLSNIIISGTSRILKRGVGEEVAQEMKRLVKLEDCYAGHDFIKAYSSGEKIEIDVNHVGNEFPAWMGSRMIANLPAFQRMWVAQSEYKEKGARAVRSCI